MYVEIGFYRDEKMCERKLVIRPVIAAVAVILLPVVLGCSSQKGK